MANQGTTFWQPITELFIKCLLLCSSGQLFEENSTGLAVPDSICTGRGVAVVSSQSKDNVGHLASVVSHMIGHAIGLLHDTEGESNHVSYLYPVVIVLRSKGAIK